MKVLIAVPTFESISPDTFKAIWDMDKPCDCGFEFVRGYDCATARNRIAQTALDGGYDFVLMVDNDVTPPRDALVNLLSHNVDACLGFYAHRNADNRPSGRTCICRMKDGNGAFYFNYPLESEYTVEEMRQMRGSGEHLVRIHGGGMGCALIRVRLFDEIDYPWFDWVNYDDEARGMLSEDLFFCERCKRNKVAMYTDTRVACGHLFRRIEPSD